MLHFITKILLFVLFLSKLQAQPQWDVTMYGLESGLPDRTVYGQVRDTNNLYWLATGSGICRFDGIRFYAFPIMDYPLQYSAFSTSSFIIDPWQRLILQLIPEQDSVGIFDVTTYESKSILGFKENRGSEQESLIHKKGRGEFVDLFAKDRAPLLQLRRSADSAFVYRLEQDTYWHLVGAWGGLPLLDTELAVKDQLVYADEEELLLYFASTQELWKIGSQPRKRYSLPWMQPEKRPFIYRDQQQRIWYLDASNQILQCLNKAGLASEQTILQQLAATIPPMQLGWNRMWEDTQGNIIFGAVGPNKTEYLQLLGKEGILTSLDAVLAHESKLIQLSGDNFKNGFTMATHGGFYAVSSSYKKLPITNYLDTILLPGQFGVVMRGFAQSGGELPSIFASTENTNWYVLEPPNYSLEPLPILDEAGKPVVDRLDCSNNLLAHEGYIYGMSCKPDKGYAGWIQQYNPSTKQWRHFSIPEENAFARIMHPAAKGKIWVFTLNRVNRDNSIFLLDTKTGIFELVGGLFVGLEKGAKGSVQYAATDSTGVLWLATTSDLYSIRPKQEGHTVTAAANGSTKLQPNSPYSIQAYFRSPASLTFITSILVLEDGKLLLGTFGNGIQLFDPATAKFSTVAYKATGQSARMIENNIPGLPSNNIAILEKLAEQLFLVATYDGFCVLDRKTKQIFTYSTEDGFPSNEFNRLSMLLDRTGQLFVGGINGFSRVDVGAFVPKRLAPKPIAARYFYLKDKARMEQDQILRAGELTQLTLDANIVYFGLDLAQPTSLPLGIKGFQTWLEGWEPDFGAIQSQAKVQYNRLKAGRYRLHIRAYDALGQQSEEDLIIPIRVRRPWYARPWVLVLSQLLLVGAIFWYNRQKVNRLRAAEVLKRQQEKRNAEMELKILRQQLNPHFIFNSLGAIQAYIQQQKSEEAVAYLADFARLMRLFLESSKQPYVSLREELELLQLYTRLEQLRFQHRFVVQYTVAQSLDIDAEEIPSLLLQPFVENAINHGLFHLPSGGELHIEFSAPMEDTLEVKITDNGVGRKAAGEIQAQSYRQHKSRASQIVAERADVLEQSGETKLAITITDLHPEAKNTGTQVCITIHQQA